jgi:para-nitrobenzyl esterase
MKITILLLNLYIINLMPLSAASQDKDPIAAGKDIAIVQTEYGAVRGYVHHGIFTFKGIPYGTAKRFMSPERAAPWQGIRSSMAYGPTCPDNEGPLGDEFEFAFNRSRGFTSNEDCLNLNIWSPKVNDAGKRPVMVWLHGGGFSSGSSLEFPSYDGENLSRSGDVIVVSINHRLNALGFLDLSAFGDKYKHSANAGVMDIVSALNWIKDNIANFGGDPGNVTIFGQSGGGAKVTCLLNTPSAKGLFHKAIVQSGSYVTHFIDPDISKRVAAELLNELGLKPDQVDSLQTMPYERLGAAGQQAIEKIKQSLKPEETFNFGLEWEPVHDGNFLPWQPEEAAAIALSANIPLLVGSCKNEYMPFILGSKTFSMDSATAKLHKQYGDKTAAFISAVKRAYPNTIAPVDYINIDFLFRPFVIRQADQKSAGGPAPVYVYLFAWQSPAMDGEYKAFHCMDLPFVFNNIEKSEEMTGGGQKAQLLATRVSEAWIQFARNGNPNHQGLPGWPAYTAKNGATMIFDNDSRVSNHPDRELLEIAARAH